MQRAKGFTLIELSIVLVIIGLVVGGVLVGRNLIKSAELQSVIADVTRFKTAFSTFRGKYNCAAGDCVDATYYLGTDSNGCPAGGGAAGTCNGNGDGRLNDITDPTHYEWYRAWQQLAQANVIEGSYTGLAGPSGTGREVVPGSNAPRSRIQGAGYSLYREAGVNLAHPARFIVEDNIEVIEFGAVDVSAPGTSYETYAGIIPPSSAYSIDAKMDDGKPASGKVDAFKSTYQSMLNCTTTDVAATSLYNLSNNLPACGLIVKADY